MICNQCVIGGCLVSAVERIASCDVHDDHKVQLKAAVKCRRHLNLSLVFAVILHHASSEHMVKNILTIHLSKEAMICKGLQGLQYLQCLAMVLEPEYPTTSTQGSIDTIVTGVGYSCHPSEGRCRYSEGIPRNICTCPSLDGESNILISVTWTLREWCTQSRSLRVRIRTPSRRLWDGAGILARS